MKECGQPRSQGSFSSWNAAGGIRRFRSEKGPEAAISVSGNALVSYLTIIPRARMASESITHEAQG